MNTPVNELERIAAGFARFADETRGESPLYAAISPAVAGDRELLALLLDAPPSQRRANLLFAAAHDLLLAGVAHPAARYYPSLTSEAADDPDDGAFEAFRDLCLSHRVAVQKLVAGRNTQTNEVRRSIAFLPVIQRLSAAGPIALVEVGASAGLNLLLDRYRYRYGDGAWIGDAESPVAIECTARGPVPLRAEPPRVAFRIGLDLRPLDAGDPEDARWLMACVWPESIERLALLRSALAVASADPPRIVAGHAVDSLEEVVDLAPAHLAVCLFHSATMPYLTEDERAAFVATLDRIARRRALHWVSLEGGPAQSFGTSSPLGRLYTPRAEDRPTDIFGLLGYAHWIDGARQDRLLARVHMHGRWIEWTSS
jgi:hypothetical protein